MKLVARLSFLLLITLSASAAEVTRAARWELHSSFWMNLHQTLMHDATTRQSRDLSVLSSAERDTWDATVATYRKLGGAGNITFARPMVITQDELTQVADDAVNPVIPGPLADTLLQVAPVYRAHWWSDDDATNRFYIGYASAMLRVAGEELAREHERVYREAMPETIRVDVTSFAGPFGAYTHQLRDGGPVATVSSRDPGYQGLRALEMILHESSHTVVSPRDGTVARAIAAAAAELDVDPPRDLWHAILFATSSELSRRALAQLGATAFEPSSADMFTRVWPQFREAIEAHWYPYLYGEGTLEEAVGEIITAIVDPDR